MRKESRGYEDRIQEAGEKREELNDGRLQL
jgi:hypothetical protein